MSLVKKVENVQPRSFSCVISGNPIPLQRPRFSVGHVYDPQRAEKHRVQYELKSQLEQPIFTGPLDIALIFFMQAPKTKKKTPIDPRSPHYKRPDLDNLIKWQLDCANGIIYVDDAQISSITAHKFNSEVPRTEITITEIL